MATTRSKTAAKVVGTLAVLGAAAATAGLGTFGTFNASTTPVDTAVNNGVVSLALSPAAAQAVLPYDSSGLMPGDHTSVALDLYNTGNVPLSALTLAGQAQVSSRLDTDRVNGLQLDLQTCATSWTVSGSEYSCAGGATDLYTGPIIMNQTLPGARSLSAGAVDHMLAVLSLPATAGNDLQGKSSTLNFVFTGVQQTGTAR